jgi:Iron-containing alcohol dehydrogenase
MTIALLDLHGKFDSLVEILDSNDRQHRHHLLEPHQRMVLGSIKDCQPALFPDLDADVMQNHLDVLANILPVNFAFRRDHQLGDLLHLDGIKKIHPACLLHVLDQRVGNFLDNDDFLLAGTEDAVVNAGAADDALCGFADDGGFVDQRRRIAGTRSDRLLAGAQHDVHDRPATGCDQHVDLRMFNDLFRRVERRIGNPVNAPLQDRIAESILQTLVEIATACLEDPPNYDARASLCWCATLALNGLIAQGVPQDWSTHMIGHEMTAISGLDHAQTLAIAYPGTLAACRKNKHAKLLQYGERIWNIHEGSEEQRIDKAIDATRSFFEGVGVKSHLKEYNLEPEIAHTIAKRLDDRGWNHLGERQDIGPEKVEEILSYSY